jgi:hypothetical protein
MDWGARRVDGGLEVVENSITLPRAGIASVGKPC